MVKKYNGGRGRQDEDEQLVSRRQLVKAGLVAGAYSAAALPASGEALAKTSREHEWDYQVDVVIAGAGASGLVAAIRARDAGLSVIVIDQNFDVGGKMLHSGAQVSLGGGDPVQLRDMKGESDKEGFIKVKPVHKAAELAEDADFLFTDVTDWSVIDPAAQAPYRFNERDLHRAWADNTAATRQFLIDNYIRFGRVNGTHPNGGISRARRASAFLMLGDETNIKAGTITRQDAGIEGKSSSHFAPRIMANASQMVAPGAVSGGAALARGLEFSAREKGVQFILNRRMTELIREQAFSGRVLGLTANYTPRKDPATGGRLESLWRNGNIDERTDTIRIKARRAVMVACGGHSGNPHFRGMFYPAFRDPAYGSSAMALLGPHGQDASGIIAGLRVGASLSGMQQNSGIASSYHIPPRLATQDSYTEMFPGHPTFPFRGSAGITLGTTSFEHLIAVNQVGKRFYNEMDIAKAYNSPEWPGGADAGSATTSMDHVQLDWRNCSPEWVRQSYTRSAGLDAAIAMNEGSQAPDFFPGPLWAIFDKGAVERDGWDIGAPFTSDKNGCFFEAGTIEELAVKIRAYQFQRVPMAYLAETVKRWNAHAGAGTDPDFGRGKDAPMHKIDAPPFFAALIAPVWHDSFGGLRINGNAQVLDMEGQIIPGLWAGGESSGGGNQHGLGRCLVHGFIAAGSFILQRGNETLPAEKIARRPKK